MKTPRNLQEYFAKQDGEMEKLRTLKAHIELLENLQRLEKLVIGLDLIGEAVLPKKKNPFQ